MSFLEVRDRGLPYGSIPYQELLNKLEETDTNECSYDHENNYNNYIRAEIIDWTLDKPFLESDKTKRDGSLSKSILNLRYNGSRGEYEHPQHPEIFIGFMDQDNRGLDNNPRMDEYNKQITTRMPNLEVRMGYNCVDTDYESPWTNQSLGQCRRDIQTSLAYNTKVFTDERDGRALNRNFVTEYDHNKKTLVYKDMLPSGINGITENESGKSNTQYTTSAVPFVSTDTRFIPSYNNINSMLIPGQKSCQRYSSNGQDINDTHINNSNNSYSLQVESKTKASSTDQTYSEHFDNSNTQNKLPGTKYNHFNTETNMNSESEYNIPVKTNVIAPSNNTTLVDNDSNFYESNHSENKRQDTMSYSNANNFITNEIYPSDLTNYDMDVQKRVINLYGNNITLLNSSFYIPEFKFKHLEIAKHGHFPDNQTIITKTNYDGTPYGTQEESHIKANKFKFNDDINKVMQYSYSNVPDTTNETQLRCIGNIKQDHKMKNTNNEDVWFYSDENTLGKTQKQSRVGGVEPIVMEVQDSYDVELNNGGSKLGTKSIRGDNLSQDMNEDLFS